MTALIVYGTRFGATVGIVETIAKTLDENGFSAVISQGDEIKLDLFDLVIVGSSIIAGKWAQKTLDFISNNNKFLSNTPNCFFVSCGEAMKPGRRTWIEKRYVRKVLQNHPNIIPISIGVFGGVFDFEGKHKCIDNPWLNRIKEKLETEGVDTSKPVDFRDMVRVKNWTLDLIDKFD